jgi:hypothetical protein
MILKGHIRREDGSPLCGVDRPVEPTALYGELCGDCDEIVRKILRGAKLGDLR